MIEQIEGTLFKLELPLPKNPLRSINCYLVKGSERFLLIDTGMNRKECLEEIRRDLGQLRVDLNLTDFFITHLHADHIGLVSFLATGNSKIFFNKTEAELVKKGEFWGVVRPFSAENGFPEDEIDMFLKEHPKQHYGPREDIVFSPISDGDKIKIGDDLLYCIETPGHSPGHTCLYDPRKKILFSGDHLLGDITPNISALVIQGRGDPLRDYFTSLDKIIPLEVDMVLPGHGNVFRNHRKRITEIKRHHKIRLDEIVSILENHHQSLTPYDIASRMTWDINGQWGEFPVTQKWFATSEALSHLIYLKNRGRVKRENVKGKWYYSLNSSRT